MHGKENQDTPFKIDEKGLCGKFTDCEISALCGCFDATLQLGVQRLDQCH
jgi:hypothetical protein